MLLTLLPTYHTAAEYPSSQTTDVLGSECRCILTVLHLQTDLVHALS